MFENGAQWLRVDFHLHTRKDNLKSFAYSGEDNNFISEYVKALKNKDIKIAAITNHNIFDLGEFKALRKKSLKNDIYLLPGVELSVNDGESGIHVLIIFNDAWLETYSNGNDFINIFLNVAFGAKDRKGRCNLSLIDLFQRLEEITKTSYFKENKKDFFVIFAHVEEKHGLWREISVERLKELWKNELLRKYTLGFQKVRTVDKLNIRQQLAEVYPAELEGSDPASLDEIGRNYCWMMIGDFNFQAVKYALRNHLDRIRPKNCVTHLYTHPFIKQIIFDGGIFNGLTLNFSSELNTFIGIRGSGKSAILESIRYALNIPLDDKAQDQDYKKNLVNYALGSGGKITVFVADDKKNEYEIRRINGEYPVLYINGMLQPFAPILSTVFNGLVYFGQKDLSFTVDGFEKSLIEKLLGDKLTDIRARIEQQKQKIIELIKQLSDLYDIEDKKKEYENKKQVVENHLDFYKKYGVEMKLQRRIDFDADIEKTNKIVRFLKSYLEAYSSFISQYEDDLKRQVISVSGENEHFFNEFFTCYKQIIASFDKLKEAYTSNVQIFEELKGKLERLINFRDELSEEFATIERKIEADLQLSGVKRINLEEFRRLKSDSYKFSQALEMLNKMEANARNISEKLSLELDNIRELWYEEFLIIENELSEINKNQTSLKIEVQYEGDKKEFINFMKSVFQGSGFREAFFENLANHFTDFISMKQNQSLLDMELGKNKEKFDRYFFENQIALLTYQVPNNFTIKYRGRELKEHSLGQRASALILFILSQKQNSVFIIDQPEDDLDNKTIYESVIKQILKMKPQAQFIFATHNPNFPVLGDAEQVLSCHYNDNEENEAISTGSIDSPKMQDEIIEIMEGGLEAFRLREEKYNTWKSMNF